MTIQSTTKLHDGVHMPWLGLGTYQANPNKKIERAVQFALELGYRHVDTAEMYDNEKLVGAGVKKSSVARVDVFITSKVWPSHFGFDKTIKACKNSLKRLGVDYIDLYLLHWPHGTKILESWDALIQCQKEGLVRSIGVSNFSQQQIDDIVKHSGVKPTVNQVEFSPFNYTQDLLEYCQQQNILLEAYAPLTKGHKLSNPALKKIAARYKKSPAQLMLRWALQHNVAVIPKSQNEERIRENSRIYDFEISTEDMGELDNLHDGFRTC
jgi:diketogulonate reductase-like aldo/keto reductase